MRKCFSVLTFTAAVWTVLAMGVWAGTSAPADDSFRNGTADRIRSDDLTESYTAQYADGLNCVKSGVSGSQFFFRSIRSGCTPPTPRAVTLDFAQPVSGTCGGVVKDAYAGGSLNTCGPNVVPDVRIVASKMFASSALTGGTPLMLVFSTPTNFTGPGGFELNFEQNVAVTRLSATARQMTAAATAIAELYQNVPNGGGGNSKDSLGRYHMPFALVVQKR